MRILYKLLLAVLPGMFTITGVFSQIVVLEMEEKTVTFKFTPGEDMFYRSGNAAGLRRLYSLVDEYREEITAGRMPIYVNGYCASLESPEDNLRTAALRSNRVKSELVMNKGLVESHFIINNHATDYNGNADVVVVTLFVPEKAKPSGRTRLEELSDKQRPEAAGGEYPESQRGVISAPQPLSTANPYRFALRTNLLYDAFMLPTLGVEWCVSNRVGVKLDGSYSYWGDEHGKVQKIWLVSPEVHWYMGERRQLYVGASGNFGEYNIYKYAVGTLFPDNTGYQGTLLGAGVSVGYQHHLSHGFFLDFNLGLGCIHFTYDSFTVTHGTRVIKEKGNSNTFWGPTQAGVTLAWTIGGSK